MIESELSRWKLHPSGHGLTAKRSESFEERESGAGVGYLLPLLLKKVREKEGKREGGEGKEGDRGREGERASKRTTEKETS